MDLEWQLDNPVIALEKYHKDSGTFIKKKTANEFLREELSSKESEWSSKSTELNEWKEKLSSMGTYVEGDIEAAVQKVIDNAQQKVNKAAGEFESQKNDLLHQKENDLQENDGWLKKRLGQLLGEDADRELSGTEKKALEYEISRRKFIAESNEKINEYQDAATQEQLDCQTAVGQLKNDQDALYSKCEPYLVKYKKIIAGINQKYQPDVKACQNSVAEKVSDRDEEIGQLQNERNREIRLAENEIEGHKRDYKKAEKQFNEQIRTAKLQGRPITKMENSKLARLNAINDQIQKVNNRVNKKISGIDQKIEVAQSKHAKIIEKAESQLDAVIRNRDQELEEPTKTYHSLMEDRDSQVAGLQSEIDQREEEKDNKVKSLNDSISSERQAQDRNNANIDQQIIEFVMSGATCFDDILDEANAPFMALQSRINVWMEMLSAIKKGKLEDSYQLEHDRQREMLASKTYPELQDELAEVSRYSDRLSVFVKNHGLLTIVGSVTAAIGVGMMAVLYGMLQMSVGLIGIAAVILGICIVVFTALKTKKEFALICKYVSLASDYQEFPGIASHSDKITRERELAKMKAMGVKAYDIYYGRTEAQSIHDAKDADIKADYIRNLKLLTKQFENYKAQIERDRDNEVKRINSDAADEEAGFYKEKENIEGHIGSLALRVEGLDARIKELKSEIDSNEQFMEAFETDYRVLEKQLQKDNWIAPMSYTHGKLSNTLYIIPENGESDDHGHRKIYRIDHNKKALVVNYDISEVEDGKVDQINKIIRDLMFDLLYAVYRMNSKETYAQFIVDEMACTNELKSTNVKNAFNIGEVAGRLEDIRRRIKGFSAQREKLARKGTSMDAYNENKFNDQDRPETYNILYIIYKPDERKGKLDDDIRMLIPECDKYGFFPVFICEKDTWEREIQEKESMYKDIKSLANNSVVVFDGVTYNMAI